VVTRIERALDAIVTETPTYVLANAISNVVDLIPPNYRHLSTQTEVYCGVQMNGPPHLGTGLTLLLIGAFAMRAAELDIVKPNIVIDIMDNVSHEVVRDLETGRPFRRPLSEFASADETRQMFEGYYGALLEPVRAAGISLHYRIFSEHQRTVEFRRALLMTLGHSARLGACLNPRSGKLPIRFPCPRCGLVEVHSSQTRLIALSGGTAVFSAYCVEHGTYEVEISETNVAPVDPNSLYRNVIKDTEHWLSNRPPAIAAKGMDWLQGCEILTRASSILEIPENARPYRLFTPLVTDRNGAKLSKSAGLPQDHYLLPKGTGLSDATASRMARLFLVASGIIDRPSLFFRSYSAERLASLFCEAS
jgi:hypothetical protein